MVLKIAQVILERAFAENNFVGQSAHISHFENIKSIQIQHNILSKSWLLKGQQVHENISSPFMWSVLFLLVHFIYDNNNYFLKFQ